MIPRYETRLITRFATHDQSCWDTDDYDDNSILNYKCIGMNVEDYPRINLIDLCLIGINSKSFGETYGWAEFRINNLTNHEMRSKLLQVYRTLKKIIFYNNYIITH